MRKLKDNEIRFIKETGFTPTVFQCDEYERTNKAPYYIDSFAEAQNIACEDFGINDLAGLMEELTSPECADAISLEEDAEYLLSTFFSKDELDAMKADEALEWLKGFKYYNGYRKWGEDSAFIALLNAGNEWDS